MPTLRTVIAIFLLTTSLACQKSDAAESGASETKVGHLSLDWDGTPWSHVGDIEDGSLKLNKKDLHLILESRVQAKGKPEPTSIKLVVSKKGLDVGTFELVPNSATLELKDEPLAWMKIIGSQGFPTLECRSGSVTFEALDTTEEGYINYGINRVRGTFQGTFQSDADRECTISGSFQYVQ